MATEYAIYSAVATSLPAVSEALNSQAAEGWRLHSILPMDQAHGKLQVLLLVLERTT